MITFGKARWPSAVLIARYLYILAYILGYWIPSSFAKVMNFVPRCQRWWGGLDNDPPEHSCGWSCYIPSFNIALFTHTLATLFLSLYLVYFEIYICFLKIKNMGSKLIQRNWMGFDSHTNWSCSLPNFFIAYVTLLLYFMYIYAYLHTYVFSLELLMPNYTAFISF